MKAYELHNQNGENILKLTERPAPKPGFNQVVVRVRATSLNYRDLIIQGNANLTQPLIPLSDGAGDVIAVGEGVTRVKVGDRVAGTFFQNWRAGSITASVMKSALGGELDGMLAECVTLNEDGVVCLPNHLSYEDGATLPCAAVTAWHALITKGNLNAGESVLVLGTGGVSIFALQFAKMHGARVIATSSSDEKLERVRSLGASETINYKTTPDWEEKVYELTDGIGVDLIVEVGGAGTLAKSMKAVCYGGNISLIGVLSGLSGEVNPQPIVGKSITMQGIYVGSKDMFEAMNRAIAQSQLKPIIDRVFPFEQAQHAYDYLKSGSHFGKVVIQV